MGSRVAVTQGFQWCVQSKKPLQMPSGPWAVPTGLGAKRPCKGSDRSVHKGSQLPRVPLVPRSTRGYWLATTPWFVVEGSS